MKTIVEQIFIEIESSNSIYDLNNCLENLKQKIPNKYFLNEVKYPPIEFTISKEEVLELGKDFNLANALSNNSHSPLEKLLLSILWKNGDFGKEQHIIEGIIGKSNFKEKKSGHVFFQFGKRLNDPENQPIIDQHIIRAFIYHKVKSDKVLTMGQLDKNHADYIEKYTDWARETSERIDPNNRKQVLFTIDKILFAIGKYIKL
jgi:hypothetical protein